MQPLRLSLSGKDFLNASFLNDSSWLFTNTEFHGHQDMRFPAYGQAFSGLISAVGWHQQNADFLAVFMKTEYHQRSLRCAAKLTARPVCKAHNSLLQQLHTYNTSRDMSQITHNGMG
jgi:hypothetical protein